MDREAFHAWLDAYGKAWQSRNPEAAARLFTDDAAYHETPFDEPFRGYEGILEYWSEVPSSQENIRFSREILAVTAETGIAHWKAVFTRLPSNASVELDGIFLVKLDGDGFCTEFREWWHRRE